MNVTLHKSLFTAFVLLVFSVIVSCSSDIKTVNMVTAQSDQPDEVAEEVELLISEKAELIARVKTPLLHRYIRENTYIEFPKGVLVEFYDSGKVVKSKLTAEWAINREKEKVMEVRKNVVVVNSKGETIQTEHLIYNEATEKIYSNVFVKITTADEIIFGEGFESDKFFNQWILRNPFGTINIKDSTMNQ